MLQLKSYFLGDIETTSKMIKIIKKESKFEEEFGPVNAQVNPQVDPQVEVGKFVRAPKLSTKRQNCEIIKGAEKKMRIDTGHDSVKATTSHPSSAQTKKPVPVTVPKTVSSTKPRAKSASIVCS